MSYPLLGSLGLTDAQFQSLRAQGCVTRESRGGRVYYKLRFREDGRQRVRYLGADQARAVAVVEDLRRLRAERLRKRQYARLKVEALAKLRYWKRVLAPHLAEYGLTFHGYEIRGWRRARKSPKYQDLLAGRVADTPEALAAARTFAALIPTPALTAVPPQSPTRTFDPLIPTAALASVPPQAPTRISAALIPTATLASARTQAPRRTFGPLIPTPAPDGRSSDAGGFSNPEDHRHERNAHRKPEGGGRQRLLGAAAAGAVGPRASAAGPIRGLPKERPGPRRPADHVGRRSAGLPRSGFLEPCAAGDGRRGPEMVDLQ